MTTKRFPTQVLLAVSTGRGLNGVTLPQVHEAIEHLLGEPVWTHQLATSAPWGRAKQAIIDQHPAFADIDVTPLDACEGASDEERDRISTDWTEAAVDALGHDELPVTRGRGRTEEEATREAFRSLNEMAKGKPVIVAVHEGEGSK